MILSEDEFFAYIHCPVHYDGAYNRGIVVPEEPSLAKMQNAVAKRFCMKLMNGEVMTNSQIKQAWDKLCDNHLDYITPQKSIQGINNLMKMYNWAKSCQLRIADINIPYCVTFNHKNKIIDFTGEIPMVGFTSDNKMELLYINFERTIPDRAVLDMSLKYTIAVYAMWYLYRKKLGVHVHYVPGDKDFYLYRSAADYRRLKDSILNVAVSISNKLFYPHENVYCASCNMKGFCRGWSNEEG